MTRTRSIKTTTAVAIKIDAARNRPDGSQWAPVFFAAGSPGLEGTQHAHLAVDVARGTQRLVDALKAETAV